MKDGTEGQSVPRLGLEQSLVSFEKGQARVEEFSVTRLVTSRIDLVTVCSQDGNTTTKVRLRIEIE